MTLPIAVQSDISVSDPWVSVTCENCEEFMGFMAGGDGMMCTCGYTWNATITVQAYVTLPKKEKMNEANL